MCSEIVGSSPTPDCEATPGTWRWVTLIPERLRLRKASAQEPLTALCESERGVLSHVGPARQLAGVEFCVDVQAGIELAPLVQPQLLTVVLDANACFRDAGALEHASERIREACTHPHPLLCPWAVMCLQPCPPAANPRSCLTGLN